MTHARPRRALRCLVSGLTLVASLTAATSASADAPANYDGPSCPGGGTNCTNTATTTGVAQVSAGGDNVAECFVKLTSNPAATGCDVSQANSGSGDNVVLINILIDQKAAVGTLDGAIELAISQDHTGTGRNRVEGVTKIVQSMTAQSSSNISQAELAAITGAIDSQTTSGDILVDLDPLLQLTATASARNAANVVQTQNPLIDLDVDLLSGSGDIGAQFKPTSAQKVVATSRTGTIEQTQSENGGIFLDIDAHTDDGVMNVTSTNEEKQEAEGKSIGAVDQEQYGPNILGMRLLSDPGDNADAVLKTTQTCNRSNCFQDNVHDCDVSTEGTGKCLLEATQTSNNTSNSQTCSVEASRGGCTISTPDGETFTCEASCAATCFSGGEGGGCFEDDGEECSECFPCEICLAAARPSDVVLTNRNGLLIA